MVASRRSRGRWSLPNDTRAIDMTVRALRLAFALLLGLLLSGCASLPSDVVRPVSYAIPASDQTALGRIAAASSPDPALSGFRLLPAGPFALDARLELLRRAERTLDLQYYHLQNDSVGRQVLRELREAARRGVRVRLLLDDLYTAEIDGLLLGLAAMPGVEVRLFNPFPSGREGLVPRFLASLNDFARVNRRMHNKLMVADGAFAVAGGRNLGEEYFRRSDEHYFIDLDVLVAGAAVRQAQDLFDGYWNSLFVYPVQSIVRVPDSAADLRAGFDNALREAAPDAGAARDLMTGPLLMVDPLGYGPPSEEFAEGRIGLIWATAEVVADPPEKVVGGTTAYGSTPLRDVVSVRYNVLEAMRRARREVVLSSPYLVPGQRGVDMLREVRQRGVAITLITNSLATNDEPLAHAGYRRYRAAMLREGVELYELSPSRLKSVARFGVVKLAGMRLHSKSAVIDREVFYIGSMNFDPRSEVHNTEMGLIIRSPELAREALRLSNLIKLQGAHRVQLAPNGRDLVWQTLDEEGEVTRFVEPETDLLTRILLNLLAPLAIEELL